MMGSISQGFIREYRLAPFYLKRLADLTARYRAGGADVAAVLGSFERDWDQIEPLRGWINQHRSDDKVLHEWCSQYADEGWELLELRRSSDEAVSWLEPAIESARFLQWHTAETRHLVRLGIALMNKGEHRAAIPAFERALAIARECDDQANEVECLHLLGKAHRNAGDQYQAAESHYQQALELVSRLGSPCMESRILTDLGNARANQGFYSEALGYYEKAENIFQLNKCREVRDRAARQGYIGNARRNLGEYDAAIAAYTVAVQLDTEVGDLQNIGLHTFNLALVYRELGRFEQQKQEMEKALDLARRTADERGISKALNGLGCALAYLRRYDEAVERHHASLDLLQRMNARLLEGYVHADLGTTHLLAGHFDHALDHLQQALHIAVDRGHTLQQQERHFLIGQVCLQQGQLALALEHIQQARQFDMEENTTTTRHKAAALHGLALARSGQTAQAQQALQEALSYLPDLQDFDTLYFQGLILAGLALLAADSAKGEYFDQAEAAYRKAVAHCGVASVTADALRLLMILQVMDPEHLLHPLRAYLQRHST